MNIRIKNRYGLINLNIQLPSSGLILLSGKKERDLRYIGLTLIGRKKYQGKLEIANTKCSYYQVFKIGSLRRRCRCVSSEKQKAYHGHSFQSILDYFGMTKSPDLLRYLNLAGLNNYTSYESLSEGERVVYNLLATIILKPTIIFADNIFSSLDPERREGVAKILASISLTTLVLVLDPSSSLLEYNYEINLDKSQGRLQELKPPVAEVTSSIEKTTKSFKGEIQLKKWYSLALVFLSLLISVFSTFMFGESYNHYQDIIAEHKIVSTNDYLSEYQCFGDGDFCYPNTFFYYGATKIQFTPTDMNSISSDVLSLFSGRELSDKLGTANAFFKSYFDLEFSTIIDTKKDDYSVSVSLTQFQRLQTKVTKEGYYLVADLENLDENNVKTRTDVTYSDILADEYSLVADFLYYQSIQNGISNIFNYAGTFAVVEADARPLKAHVLAPALDEYVSRGGFTNTSGVDQLEHTSFTHHLEHPERYYKRLKRLADARQEWLLTVYIAIPLLVFFLALFSFLTIKFNIFKGDTLLSLQKSSEKKLTKSCLVSLIIPIDLVMLIGGIGFGCLLKSAVHPYYFILISALTLGSFAIKAGLVYLRLHLASKKN